MVYTSLPGIVHFLHISLLLGVTFLGSLTIHHPDSQNQLLTVVVVKYTVQIITKTCTEREDANILLLD